MSNHKEKTETIVAALECGMVDLTQWESEFIESIMIQQENNKNLSWKQSKVLNRILEKVE